MDKSEFYTLPKAELHTHLDGSIRSGLIYQYAKIKQLKEVEGVYSQHQIIKNSTVEEVCQDLNDYLAKFALPIKAIAGVPDAIQKLAYDVCYEKYDAKIFYSELRFSPHEKFFNRLSRFQNM